jgi:hypothetical protein
MSSRRAASSVLLAAGVVLVFAGLISALGVSPAGIVASSAAIAALLYAGGVWFGEAPRADLSLVLFTRTLVVAGGPLKGRPVVDLFPNAVRADVEARCREALAGGTPRFTCGSGTGDLRFSVTPVRDDAGVIVYGLLLSGSLVAQEKETGEPSVASVGMSLS